MRISPIEAIECLRQGHVVALPTETVYGLAASIKCLEGIEKIFEVKNRPLNNPLIVHVANINQISNFAPHFPQAFIKLAQKFWPGPLTLILPIDISTISPRICAGLSTAAFRVPSHPITLQIIEEVGPLVMPSANLSGSPSSTKANHVENDFGVHFPVVDGGTCEQGVESTILHYADSQWHIGRLGAIPAQAFEEILGYVPLQSKKPSSPICPGQMYRHYSPKAKLHLCDRQEECRNTVIGFSNRSYLNADRVLSLGRDSSPEQAAEALYRILRQLDEQGIEEAWVDMDFPKEHLWVTIAERLCKAALQN